MFNLIKRIWKLVGFALQAHRLYEFLRDHFDNDL
ncbi:hypothetical protein ALP59_200141 [Pseudomonas savastanoi]|uniref:Uncharacterized protein n=1 Tax=Pseudomonas savastanoi TaxID=29438 RepID=A0A3M5G957_PSESS|nr:hypothetical protein ALP59_200141 [Pseudomonas savastanoi]